MSWRLYVDFGNSAVKLGIPSPDGWARLHRHELGVAMPDMLQRASCRKELAELVVRRLLATIGDLASEMNGPEAVVAVCSNRKMQDLLAEVATALGAPLRRLGEDFKHKIKSKYARAQLGQDRVANLAAALDRYQPPLIIIDAGTCLTIDAVDEERVHRGGLILAGRTAVQAGLAETVPQLLNALRKPSLPDGFIGTNTAEALTVGQLVATAGTIVYAVGGIQRGLNARDCRVIICGGDAQHLQMVSRIGEVDEWLTLDGLRLIDEAAYPPL